MSTHKVYILTCETRPTKSLEMLPNVIGFFVLTRGLEFPHAESHEI